MQIFKYIKKTEHADGRTTEDLLLGKIVTHAIVVIFAAIAAMNSWTTVPAGHVKVKTLFGKVEHEELKEGFHLASPLADFSTYDGRKQTYNLNKIMVPSQDKLKTTMDVSVIYSLTTSVASEMKQEIGTLEEFEAKILVPKARSLVREVGKGVERSQDFFLDHVQQNLQAETTEKLAAFLIDKGVVVHNVLFRDVTLPGVVSQAIIQTKKRQEEVNQEKAKLDIVEQQAQQQVIQAQAKEKAAISEAVAKKTMADAEAYKIKAEAVATAEANELINKTLTKDLIESSRINKWDGKYPTTMMTGASGTLLNIPIK